PRFGASSGRNREEGLGPTPFWSRKLGCGQVAFCFQLGL
ncbi:hypothetical protein AK812_SmicGene20423, partial [Symbiodinium microadriaticum]